MSKQKRSGYKVPFNTWYNEKLYEIGTGPERGYPQKVDAQHDARILRKVGHLARVKRFSRKVEGRTVVRYHVYVKYRRA